MIRKKVFADGLQLGDHVVEPPELEGYVAEVRRFESYVTVGYTDRTKAVMHANELVVIEVPT